MGALSTYQSSAPICERSEQNVFEFVPPIVTEHLIKAGADILALHRLNLYPFIIVLLSVPLLYHSMGSKMADGRHLGFRFWAVISASINIFAPNFVPTWKIGSIRGSISQKSDFRKSKMADGRHLGFRFWPIISASINILAPNFVSMWKMCSPRVSRSQKSDFRKCTRVQKPFGGWAPPGPTGGA